MTSKFGDEDFNEEYGESNLGEARHEDGDFDVKLLLPGDLEAVLLLSD